MNTTLIALVRRIWQRAYLDTEEECARWIDQYIESEQLHKPVVGGPVSDVRLEGEQLPAEGRGEANTCAGFWCQNEMYGKPRCSEVCTWCHGYRRG